MSLFKAPRSSHSSTEFYHLSKSSEEYLLDFYSRILVQPKMNTLWNFQVLLLFPVCKNICVYLNAHIPLIPSPILILKINLKKLASSIFLIMETYQFYEIYTFYFRNYLDQETAPLVNEESLMMIILALINSKCHFKKKRLIYVKSFRPSSVFSICN